MLVRTPGRPRLEAGAIAHLNWSKQAESIFDDLTGRRIPDNQEILVA